jgi:hypothetical protein
MVFAGAWLGNGSEIPWFPSETELRSSGVYVYPVKMLLHGTVPTAAELIFVRPADNMVFYFGAKS